MKRSKNILALGLALALFIANMANVSAFNAGSTSKKYTYSTMSGYVTIMADVTPSSSATYYKFKGTITCDALTKLRVVVKGYYYDSRGILCNYSDSKEDNDSVVTAGGYVSGVGVCDSSHRSSSIGYVLDNKVKTAYYPPK